MTLQLYIYRAHVHFDDLWRTPNQSKRAQLFRPDPVTDCGIPVCQRQQKRQCMPKKWPQVQVY